MRPRDVAPGIQSFAARTPTLPPATHTQSYALGTRDVLLVEPATPYDDEAREWLAWARGLASQGRNLVAIFVTHHHGDHVGGADFLSRELGLPLWAHEMTRERLERRRPRVEPTAEDPHPPSVGARIARLLSDGETISLDGPEPQRWTVLHTPGHAPGHLCLHEPALGAVVVGDMVATVGTILVEPRDGHMRTYLDQLARLRDLGATLALPAHGDAIPSPRALFEYYLRHRAMRQDRVIAALRHAGDAGGTAADLLADAYADTPREVWPIAVLSLRAHLDKLVEDGQARADGDRFRVV